MEIARAIRAALEAEGIEIRAFAVPTLLSLRYLHDPDPLAHDLS